MPQDTTQQRVGVTGRLFVAAALTAGPTATASSWPGAFVDLGLCDPAGPSFGPKPTFKDLYSWQQFFPTRTLKTQDAAEIKFKLQQTNGTILKLAFGGGAVTGPVSGDYTYTPPTPGTVDERAVGLEINDGTIIERYTVARAIVSAMQPIVWKRDEYAAYDLTFTVLGVSSGSVWTKVSNDAAMAS